MLNSTPWRRTVGNSPYGPGVIRSYFKQYYSLWRSVKNQTAQVGTGPYEAYLHTDQISHHIWISR